MPPTNVDVSLACEYNVGTSDKSEKIMNVVKTPLIKIGNSRGIRIPKVLIDQVGLGDEVEIDAQRGQLVIRPTSRPRYGWDEQFQAMVQRGDDRLLDEPTETHWDRSEWKW